MGSKSFSRRPDTELSSVSKRSLQWLLLAGAGLLSNAASAEVPEWLRQLESVSLPEHDAETDAVVLLDDEEVTVLPDGSVRYVERHAFRILRRAGQARGVARTYLDKNDVLVSIRGWSIPKEGKPFETSPKDVIESALVPGSEAALATDWRMKSLDIPASNPGNLVGYAIERIAHPTMMGDQWIPRDSIPVLRSRFRLRLSPGWTHSATWINGGSANPVSPEPGMWEWEMTNLEPIKVEGNAPPLPVLAETLHVSLYGPTGKASSFRDWNDMGGWFNSLLNERSDVNAAITSGIAAHSVDRATLFEKVKALSEFAQKDVRYVEIALGKSGYQPRSPTEVLRTGYGDCKDKANFLRVMLREIGVESHLVLVNTERAIVSAGSLPAPMFDHAVIAIRLPADANAQSHSDMAMINDGKRGKLLLFDPTDTLTPFGHIGRHLHANTVLLVLEDSAHLVTTPVGVPAESGVDKVVTVKLSEDGTLSGTVREAWRGVWANYERERMMGADQIADLIKPLDGRLSGSISNYQVEDAAVISRTVIEKPFEWRYTLSAREYARKAGDLIMIRPRVLGSKVDRFLETGERRRNPVAFEATHKDVDTMRIELPQGYIVESLPEPVTLDISFAAYRSSVRMDGNVMVYERVLEQKALDLPLSRVDELREFYRAISRDERAMAVLRKK